MNIIPLFRFEFGHLLRRISTWLYVTVLLLFTLVMKLVISPGDGVYANNTFYITAITVVGGLIWLVMGASIAGEAAAGDVKMRMHPLIYATPVRKFDLLGGRFLAAFTVNALLVFSLPLGMMLSFYLPGMEHERLLPFRPAAYLNVFFLIALPNAFIATALQFSLAVLTRQVMSSYAASLLLAIVTQIVAIALAKLLGNWELVKLLDPVGVAGIVGGELATWTPSEKNTRLLLFEGMFLWNRMIWLGIAAGSLVLSYRRFNHTYAEGKWGWSRFTGRRRAPRNTATKMPTPRLEVAAVPVMRARFGRATSFAQTIRIATASFKKIFWHPVALTTMLAVTWLSVVFSHRIMTQFGIPLHPTTQQVLSYLANPVGNLGTPWVIIPLLIIYFTGVLTWQERDARISDLMDAAPVQEWVLLTGKFMGFTLVLVAWTMMMMAGGIAMQLSMNYHKVEPGLYLQVLAGLQFTEYLGFALLAFAVHIVVNQRYVSYLVLLLMLIFIAFPSTFRVEHNLLIWGAAPKWSYTDMRGFGRTLDPWVWFKLYWTGWALLLSVIARLLWMRGRQETLKDRLKTGLRRFTGNTTRVAITGLALAMAAGSFIFYNTNILNEYQGSTDINERKAEYERRYGRYRNTPQPRLTGTKLQVEIYPDRQQVEIHALYTLTNNHTVPIDSIHLYSVGGITVSNVQFTRPATSVVIDRKLGYQVYALHRSLLPGDSLLLDFDVHYQEAGFRNTGKKGLVMKNGTYFTNFDLLPVIGYQRYGELADAVVRKKYNLPARPAIPSLYDPEARKRPAITDQNRFEAIVGTAKDEVAVGPGRLLNSRTAGDRRYFHFKTDAAIRGEYSVLSGRYKVLEATWNHVAIRIYHAPEHARNINRMLQSIQASLAFYTQQFGPYLFGHFTIVERGGVDGGLSSEATMVDYGEQFSLLDPDRGPQGFNLPYYIVAHEVAHQWWGGASLRPAYVEGAGVLIEGLAVYSGMQVLEKDFGEHHLKQMLNFVHSFYDMPRSLATPPLLQANDAFLYYRKSGLAMYALSKYIGKEKVNGALRRLLQKHHSGDLPLPTTLDLLYELQSVTPDSLRYLLTDLFERNTYWRLQTETLAAVQNNAGSWTVTMKVQAHKVVVDSTGKEDEMPMNDWLEIGFYENSHGLDKPLYVQLHRIRSGAQLIQVTLPRKPDSGGIDPNHLMIDIRLDDNIVQLGR